MRLNYSILIIHFVIQGNGSSLWLPGPGGRHCVRGGLCLPAGVAARDQLAWEALQEARDWTRERPQVGAFLPAGSRGFSRLLFFFLNINICLTLKVIHCVISYHIYFYLMFKFKDLKYLFFKLNSEIFYDLLCAPLRLNIIIVAEGAIDREGNAISAEAIKKVQFFLLVFLFYLLSYSLSVFIF